MNGEGREKRRLSSRLGRSTTDHIFVRGHDLSDLIGNVSLGDVAYLELTGRRPTSASR